MWLINHIFTAGFVGAFTLTMALPGSAAWAADKAFQVVAGQRQLFLDDVGIVKIENLTRTMHPPDKKGAVIRPNVQWGEQSKQTRTAPVWNPQRRIFQFWDLFGNNAPLSDVSGYYESKDGLHWFKPAIGQIEFRGSKENNYVAIPLGGGRRTRPGCVVYDPTDPDPSRRYKGFGHGGGGKVVLGVSPDGVNWKSLGVAISSADEYNFNFDPVEHLFIVTLRHNGGPYGRAVDLATSKDFENWTHHGLMFHADKLDQELGRKNMEARLADPTLSRETGPINPAKCMVDVYNMGVSWYEGLYIGFPAMFHRTGNDYGFHLVQLVCSRDMKTWKRLGDRKTFIGPSRMGSGAYDLTQLIGPSRAVVRGDELWFYYTGLKYRDVPEGADLDQSAICLAVLRRDGYISLDAGEQEGMVVTDPLKLPGTKLFVNVDAVKGELRVEVLDGEAKVVAQSEPLSGDLLREPVTWTDGDIADFKDQTVSLRFTLRNGQFYSYWLE